MLAELGDCDAEWLPQADLSGEWADGLTPRALWVHCGGSDGDLSFWPDAPESLTELCDRYEDTFSHAAEIEAHAVLTSRKEG